MLGGSLAGKSVLTVVPTAVSSYDYVNNLCMAEFVRLNKYISSAGVCSRRQADVLISSGFVKVNGIIKTELGCTIKLSDIVEYEGKVLGKPKLLYILLNKPKDCITTSNDPQGRKTVFDILGVAYTSRIYPVGRLDRNTTGLLMLTNDGDLAKNLSHPSGCIKKVYNIELNRPLKSVDFKKILSGVILEDGVVNVDDFAILSKDKRTVGVELHSGRNRVIRRLFEQLEYEIVKLDRVVYGNLTKKNLPLGKWRELTITEISDLMSPICI